MDTDMEKGTLWHNSDSSSIANLKQSKIYQKRKVLQAQGKSKRCIKSYLCGLFEVAKRVSLSLSVSVKASITVEASLVIPLFLFCFLEILSLLQALAVYSEVLCALKNAVYPISVYGCMYEELTENDEEIQIGKQLLTSVVFSELYLDGQMHKQCSGTVCQELVEGGIKGISTLGSHVNSKTGCLSAYAYYNVKPVFSLSGKQMRMCNKLYVKLWTGYGAGGKEAPEDYVYITEFGKVYHVTTECTHLKLSVHSVKAGELVWRRNDYGDKYRPCEKCCEDVSYDNYYVTKKGDRYHKAVSCSGLKRSVSCVPKKDVEDWKLCEKCGADR